MLFYLQAIFVSFVILHQNNIWVALIPKPSLMIICIGAYIYSFSILLRRFYLIKYPARIFIILFVSFLVMFAAHFVIGREVRSIIGYWLVTGISVIIVLLWGKRQEIYAIKVFIIFCTIISLLGIIAWLIVNFTFFFQGYVDQAQIIDLSEFTGGRMGRGYGHKTNVFGVDMDAYSFPYSLGLVLTGSYAYELLGIPFFRASGIFHEPSTAGFMTISAFILTCNSTYFGKWQRRTFLTLQLFFILFSMSLSVVISLISVFILYNILDWYKKNLSRGNVINPIKMFRFVVIISLVVYIGYYSYHIPSVSGMTKNILTSKLNYYAYKLVTVGHTSIMSPSLFVVYFYFLVVSLYCFINANKYNNDSLMFSSLIMICFLVFALKGYFQHLIIYPAFFIFFSLMIKNLGKSISPSRSHQLGYIIAKNTAINKMPVTTK